MNIKIEDEDARIAISLLVTTFDNYRVDPAEVAKIFERLCDDLRLRIQFSPQRLDGER